LAQRRRHWRPCRPSPHSCAPAGNWLCFAHTRQGKLPARWYGSGR
jgi:hypothetical protein